MTIRIYEVSLETLKPYITGVDSAPSLEFTTFNLFGVNTNFKTIDVKPHNTVFITVEFDQENPIRVSISKSRRLEHMGIKTSSLIDDLVELNYQKEIEMFDNFKITEVKLKDEIHGIALKAAVESLISTGCLGDVKIEMEDGKPFLVKGGEVEALASEGFNEKAEKFLVGKTKEELAKIASDTKRKGYIMCHLINGLNLIESYTAERCQSSILG